MKVGGVANEGRSSLPDSAVDDVEGVNDREGKNQDGSSCLCSGED